jgi:hypothetical protein
VPPGETAFGVASDRSPARTAVASNGSTVQAILDAEYLRRPSFGILVDYTITTERPPGGHCQLERK